MIKQLHCLKHLTRQEMSWSVWQRKDTHIIIWELRGMQKIWGSTDPLGTHPYNLSTFYETPQSKGSMLPKSITTMHSILKRPSSLALFSPLRTTHAHPLPQGHPACLSSFLYLLLRMMPSVYSNYILTSMSPSSSLFPEKSNLGQFAIPLFEFLKKEQLFLIKYMLTLQHISETNLSLE